MRKMESDTSDELRPEFDLRNLGVRKVGPGRKIHQELLAAARLRVQLPPGKLWLDYQDDVDTLYIRLKENTQSTHSESDLDNMVIFDYEGDELVGVEIMDITGQLKDADPS